MNEQAETKKYRAFISYKHGHASYFSEALAQALASYSTNLFESPREIFRDEDYVKPTADIPTAVNEALADSDYLILLASPEAAHSPWVLSELNIWCETHNRTDKIIIVHTEGNIETDSHRKCIVWENTDALPHYLRDRISDDPLIIDATALMSDRYLDLEIVPFRDAVNRIVSQFYDLPPVEMSGVAQLKTKSNNRLKRIGYGIVSVSIFIALFIGTVALERNEVVAAFIDYNTAPDKKSKEQQLAIQEQCEKIRNQEDLPLKPPVDGSQTDIDAIIESCAPLNNLTEAEGGISGLTDKELIKHMSIQWIYNDGGARSNYFRARILKGERPYEALVHYVQSHNLNKPKMNERRPQCALLKLGRKKAEAAFCRHSDQKP